MKTVLMVLLVLVASAATAVAGYFYGFDQGQTQAQNVRAEFLQTRSGLGAPTGGNTTGTSTQTGQPGALGQRAGGNVPARGAIGVIKSVQGNTIQITSTDGSALNVTIDPTTTIQILTTGTHGDLRAGERITVQGNVSGNNVTARTIIVGLGQ